MSSFTDKMRFTLPDFMASPDGKNDASRPRPLQLSKSFSKLEPSSPDRSTRPSRANTIQNGAIPTVAMIDSANGRENKRPGPQTNIFENDEDEEGHEATAEGSGKLPADFDELPIELVSLADRFFGPNLYSSHQLTNCAALLTHFPQKYTQLHRPLRNYPLYFKTFTQLRQIISTLTS